MERLSSQTLSNSTMGNDDRFTQLLPQVNPMNALPISVSALSHGPPHVGHQQQSAHNGAPFSPRTGLTLQQQQQQQHIRVKRKVDGVLSGVNELNQVARLIDAEQKAELEGEQRKQLQMQLELETELAVVDKVATDGDKQGAVTVSTNTEEDRSVEAEHGAKCAASIENSEQVKLQRAGAQIMEAVDTINISTEVISPIDRVVAKAAEENEQAKEQGGEEKKAAGDEEENAGEDGGGDAQEEGVEAVGAVVQRICGDIAAASVAVGVNDGSSSAFVGGGMAAAAAGIVEEVTTKDKQQQEGGAGKAEGAS